MRRSFKAGLLKVAALAAALALTASSALAADRRPDRTRLSIMTFNVQFMWDGRQPEEGRVNFPWKGKPALAEARMAKLVAVISRYNPDMVCLAEVENRAALNLFNRKFLAGQGYRAYFVQGRSSRTGLDLGLLTRIDPRNGRIERSDWTGRSRSTVRSVPMNFYARFVIGRLKLALVGLHLIAHPDEPKRVQVRQAQAEAIRRRSLALNQAGYSVVVLGDFNDFDRDPGDHLDHRPLARTLAIVKTMDRSDPADDLINLARLVPKRERYTDFGDANHNRRADFPEEFSSLDHILVSPELLPRVVEVKIPHDHDPQKLTDHFPVLAVIKTAY